MITHAGAVPLKPAAEQPSIPSPQQKSTPKTRGGLMKWLACGASSASADAEKSKQLGNSSDPKK